MSTLIQIKRGDTGRYDIACFTKAGGPLSLVGAVLRLYAKLDVTALDAAASIKKDSAGIGGITITDAGNGLARLVIAPSDTSAFTSSTQLYFDLQVTEADGTVTTLFDGILAVSMDVTQTS